MWWFDCVCVVFLISLDKDECATREAKCPPYSTCVNTDGSYRCQCESGRILNNNKCDGMITSLKLPACVLKRKKTNKQTLVLLLKSIFSDNFLIPCIM